MEEKKNRKRLSEDEKKKGILIKFNQEEKRILKEKALIYCGGNMSRYIRNCSLKNSVDSKNYKNSGIGKEDFFSMVREINKQGSNLNQLVKFYNSGIKKEGDIYFLLKAILDTNNGIFEKLLLLLESKAS